MSQRLLILVKHAMPDIKPEHAASTWTLSDAGRASCGSLADALARYGPALIVSSAEPKARETADLIGTRLAIPVKVANNLHEHDRTGVPFLDDPAAWEASVARFFAELDALVLGRETASACRDRFVAAIDTVLQRHPRGNIAIIAHGTVISLLTATRAGLDPMSLWRKLALPSFVVLRLPSFDVEAVMERLPGDAAGLSRSDDQRYTHPAPDDHPSF